jgi:hypothetical protein
MTQFVSAVVAILLAAISPFQKYSRVGDAFRE